jgi:purine-binding chemotaxis protein CheW
MTDHKARHVSSALLGSGDTNDYVTMSIADQVFGIPVLKVQDVLGPQRITRIPLAPKEIAGSLNLRGRIVTAIDIRQRLDLPAMPVGHRNMSIVVESKNEMYSLIVDKVGEVMSLEKNTYEKSPATLDPKWRDIAGGIHRLESRLLIVLDIERLLSFADIGIA